MKALRKRLVDDWCAAWRWVSMQMMALAVILQVVPAEAFLSVYALAPPDIQMLLPSRTALVVFCLAVAMIGRIWKQKPKRRTRRDETA